VEYTKEFLLNHIANLEKQLDSHKRQIILLERRLRFAYSKVEDNTINEDQLELDCE
jgi:hypothetical protein